MRASMLFSDCATASDRAAWNEDHIAGVPLSVSEFIYIGCHVLSSSMPVTVVSSHRLNSFPLTAQ